MESSEGMKTSCLDCIFATLEPIIGTDQHEQTGCELNRLEKFQKIYCTEQLETPVQDAVGFYILNGICNAVRTNKWKETHNLLTQKQIQEQLDKEISIKLDVVLLNRDTDLIKIENNIRAQIANLAQNQLHPTSIIFSSLVPLNFATYISIVKRQYNGVFHIVNPILDTSEKGVLDACIARAKGNYYLVHYLDTTKELSDILDYLNEELNFHMKKFIMIKPYEGFDGLVVQRQTHKMLNGNIEGSIIEKIEHLNKEQKAKMVLEWSKLRI